MALGQSPGERGRGTPAGKSRDSIPAQASLLLHTSKSQSVTQHLLESGTPHLLGVSVSLVGKLLLKRILFSTSFFFFICTGHCDGRILTMWLSILLQDQNHRGKSCNCELNVWTVGYCTFENKVEICLPKRQFLILSDFYAFSNGEGKVLIFELSERMINLF